MVTLSPILAILAGLVLLLTGRRIFWLAAALAAFLFTYQMLENWLGPGPGGLLVAAVIGLVLAFLAIRFIRFIGFLIGLLAGAAAMPYLLGMFGIQWPWWVMALIGAVIGVIVVSIAFDWGLILLTSWLGANAVASNLGLLLALSAGLVSIIMIVLLVLGIAAQVGFFRGAGRERR